MKIIPREVGGKSTIRYHFHSDDHKISVFIHDGPRNIPAIGIQRVVHGWNRVLSHRFVIKSRVTAFAWAYKWIQKYEQTKMKKVL